MVKIRINGHDAYFNLLNPDPFIMDPSLLIDRCYLINIWLGFKSKYQDIQWNVFRL